VIRKLQELWVLAREEKQKLGVLVVLFSVLGGLGVRTFVSGGPRSAVASNSETKEEKSSTDLAIEKINSERSRTFIRTVRPGRLDRNLFSLDVRFFPEAAQPSQVEEVRVSVVTEGVQTVDEPAVPSGPTLAELILEEADHLKLRSTLVGSNAIAVIELGGGGKGERMVLGVGQTIEGFRVEEIRSTIVVLEKQGVRVELRLALPEGQ
jgi:hypothetical protein